MIFPQRIIPFLAIALLCSIVFTAGCRKRAPVLNLNNNTVASVSENKSIEKVEKAISAGAASLGWKTEKTSPGLITATLFIRTHTAVVEIPYTLNSFSIIYKSSINLKYRDGKIHPNYNRWVQNLSNAISAELAKI